MKLFKSAKVWAALPLAASLCLPVGGSAFAFSDVKGDPGAAQIYDLQQRGIIQGVGSDQFKPQGKVNGAVAVSLIVKGLGLNLDTIRFVKEPKASDYFSKVPDNASYAQAFIVAQLNGLDLPRDIDPAKNVTREQFANWLFQGITKKGNFAVTEQFIMFGDGKRVTDGYMDGIQKLLILKIAQLDAAGNFRPQDAITRSEAAVMLDKAIVFVEKTSPIPDVPATSPLGEPELTSAAYADGVTKATISASAPHPGYGLEVSSIVFAGDQATLNYRVTAPDPNGIYPQVITTVRAEAYLPAKYKPVLGTLEGVNAAPSSDGSAGGADGAAGGAAGGSTGFPINE